MAINYTKLQTTADNLIKNAGWQTDEAYVLRFYNPDGVNVKFYEKPGFLRNFAVACVVLPLSKSDKSEMIESGKQEIHKYSKILLSAETLTEGLEIGDFIVTEDQCYKVFGNKPLKPYKTTIMYTAIVENAVEPEEATTVLADQDGKIMLQANGKAIGFIKR